MSELNPENFFDQTGGGSGAPSAQLKNLDDFVFGEIVDQFMAPATDFSTKKQKVDTKTGKPIEQLVLILQTDQRNWAGVSRVPLKDKDDASSGPKDPSEDDGKRAVYVEPWTNIHAAVGKAVVEATGQKGPVRNGGKIGVKIVELKDTGKGNPLKIHAAKYEAPTAATPSEGFFNETAASTPAPATTPAPPPAQTAAPAPAPQPVTDPWGTPTADPSKPPF